MDYKIQRKFFNFFVLEALVKQLRYAYAGDEYRKKVRDKNLKRCMENAY